MVHASGLLATLKSVLLAGATVNAAVRVERELLRQKSRSSYFKKAGISVLVRRNMPTTIEKSLKRTRGRLATSGPRVCYSGSRKGNNGRPHRGMLGGTAWGGSRTGPAGARLFTGKCPLLSPCPAKHLTFAPDLPILSSIGCFPPPPKSIRNGNSRFRP